MAKPPKPVSPMEDDESVVEELPRGSTPQTNARLGKAQAPTAGSSGMPVPAPVKRREGLVSRVAAGLRAPAKPAAASSETRQRLLETQRSLQQLREERRQAVWDKLDAAKRAADEKAERLRSFSPGTDQSALDDLDASADDMDLERDEDFDL